jgi:hypothetical protein
MLNTRSTFGSKRFLRQAIAVASAVVVLAGAAVLLVRGQDSATPVDANEALERYRAAATATTSTGAATPAAANGAAPDTSATNGGATPTNPAAATGVEPAPTYSGPGLPAVGVYTYLTSGGEQVDVLGGTQHRYPERTTITISSADC